MKAFQIIIVILSCVLSFLDLVHGGPLENKDVFVLISASSEIKKDYHLKAEKFVALRSRVGDFGKVSWTMPEMILKAEKHINEVQIKRISPGIQWPPDEYNKGRDYPVIVSDLMFVSAELCRQGDFLYWKLKFLITDNLGGSHSTFVACYLNGEIAEIVDHKAEE